MLTTPSHTCLPRTDIHSKTLEPKRIFIGRTFPWLEHLCLSPKPCQPQLFVLQNLEGPLCSPCFLQSTLQSCINDGFQGLWLFQIKVSYLRSRVILLQNFYSPSMEWGCSCENLLFSYPPPPKSPPNKKLWMIDAVFPVTSILTEMRKLVPI